MCLLAPNNAGGDTGLFLKGLPKAAPTQAAGKERWVLFSQRGPKEVAEVVDVTGQCPTLSRLRSPAALQALPILWVAKLSKQASRALSSVNELLEKAIAKT